MASEAWSVDVFYTDTFLSETPQNFDSGTAEATGTMSPPAVYAFGPAALVSAGGSAVYITGFATAGAAMTALSLPYDSWTGSIPIAKTELGYNPYLEWGYWTLPGTITGSNSDYKFDNKGYYIWGDKTTTLPTTIFGTYSGNAYGTVWSPTGGVDKTGTFSMDVNYSGGSGTISNFNVLVGGDTGVSQIGTHQFNQSGNYSISGTGQVNGVTGSGTASGAFYGPAAEYTGGAWKATVSGEGISAASGVFVGKKQ